MKKSNQFNPKNYQGKDRIMSKVQIGISKCWKWDSEFNEYRFLYYEARKKGTFKKEIKSTFQDLKEAKDWLYNSDQDNKQIDNSPLFQEVVEKWFKNYLSSKRYGTKNYYVSKLKYFQPLNQMQIESIRPKHLDSWVEWLKSLETKDSRTSFLKELKFIRIIFLFYKDISENAYDVPIRKYHYKNVVVKEAPLKQKVLLEPDFIKFRDYLDLKPQTKIYAALATVQYYHCLRISEATAIFKEDLKFDDKAANNSISIQRKIEWPRKKGDQIQVDDFFKNSRSIGIKSFMLHPAARSYLLPYYNSSEGGPLFQIAGKILSYRNIQFNFNKAFKAVGLAFTSTHCLRTGSATEYFNKHGSAALVQSQLGVTSMKTAQVYAKPIRRELDAYTLSLYGSEEINGGTVKSSL